ncbi:unnamed protein product [Effrenium voratum]|nr:unnamed protein product [Effrenium voratum]
MSGYVLPKDDESPARLDGVLAMSRAFGNFRFKDDGLAPGERKVSSVPEVAVFDAAAGDVILLASDGVMDVMSSQEAADLAVAGLAGAASEPAVEAAADVIFEALDSTQDNATCAVIQLGPGFDV